MKHLFYIIFLILSLFVVGQNFEGIVTYEVEMKNLSPIEKTPEGGFPNQIHKYYYKNGYYKSELKGFIQLYDAEDNRLYEYKKGAETAIWRDGAKYFDKIIEIEKLDDTENILGVPCESIKIKSTIGETIYFFSKKFKLNPVNFKGHRYGLWEDYLKETGALPLKYIYNTLYSKIISTAIDIEEKSLSEDVFEIPNFKEINQAPF